MKDIMNSHGKIKQMNTRRLIKTRKLKHVPWNMYEAS